MGFKFPIIKLLDYRRQWSALETSNNPLCAGGDGSPRSIGETRGKMTNRLQWKLSVVKGLYERGFSREDILELFRFIDWLMALPADLARRPDL